MPYNIAFDREAREDLKRLRKYDQTAEDVLLTENGHVRARVERFDDDDWEDWLFEHDPKAIQAAEAAQ